MCPEIHQSLAGRSDLRENEIYIWVSSAYKWLHIPWYMEMTDRRVIVFKK